MDAAARAAAERRNWTENMDAADRAAARDWARRMMVVPGTDDDPPSAAEVDAEAMRAAFAGTAEARADDAAHRAAAAAERAAHAARPMPCTECGGETDPRARAEHPGGAMCWKCATDGAEHTAAGRMMMDAARAAGFVE